MLNNIDYISYITMLVRKDVMDNISNMSNNVTIIMIAHRLTTLMNCDTIFLIEKGKLADSGTYTDLIKNNSFFRKMAKLNK